MDDEHLSTELIALAPQVAFPPTPPLVPDVITGIVTRRRRRRFATVAAVVAVATLVLGLLPGPRQAIARMLGIGSVRIERVATLDLPPATATAADLGTPATVAEAAAAAGFSPLIPSLPGLGTPDVFVKRGADFTLITLRYAAADGSPGLIITQLSAESEVFVKQLDETTTAREVMVDDALGLWLQGGSHTVAFFTDGDYLEDTARLIGNTLLWARGSITIRIESELPMDEALAIAASMRPAGD
jgi:hypothetical protein